VLIALSSLVGSLLLGGHSRVPCGIYALGSRKAPLRTFVITAS
jgi:hypothetical protein